MGIRLTRREFFAAAGTGASSAVRSLNAAAIAKDRITSVQAWPVALRPEAGARPPKFSSDFDEARRRWRGPFAQLAGAVIVEIRTEQGLAGYGMGGGGGAAAYIIKHHLREMLVGVNPANIELLNDQMYSSTAFFGGKGLAVMAISGIDLALWDVAGQRAGKPVYELLGGMTREKTRAYYTGNDIEQAMQSGFHAFKLPIAEGAAEGRDSMKRIQAKLTRIRNLIGHEADLTIDCNSLWDVPYTIEMADRLAPLRIGWFEEPLLPGDVAGYETLCARIRGPLIAHGEHEYRRTGFEELIRHQAIQLLQPDLTWSGGLTEARRIADLAAAHSLPIVPHRGGSAYGMALITAAPNCYLAESFGTGEAGNELMAALTSKFENGFYYPNTGPGFGTALNETLIRKYAHD